MVPCPEVRKHKTQEWMIKRNEKILEHELLTENTRSFLQDTHSGSEQVSVANE